MANMKDKIRTVTSKITIAGIAGAGTLAVLLCSGCAKKPESVSEIVVEVSEPVSEIETSEQPSEVVAEEVKMPEFILYDENGELYVPQEVTADDIYARIDELLEKYDFENDWERDRVIGILLFNNSCYMSEEDINTIYDDYLANFGGQNISQQYGFEISDLFDKTNKVELSDYFIDEKIAEEADRFCEYIESGDMQKYSDKFEEVTKLVGDGDYSEEYYTPLAFYYYSALQDNNIAISENVAIYESNKRELDVLNYDIINIKIANYVSSHQE